MLSSIAGNLSVFKIRAGSSLHGRDGGLFDVKKVVQHEKYNRKNVDYDFSLIELETPLELDETKRAIKLHNFDEVFPDESMALVSGWGNTQNVSESRLQLRGS